MAVLGAVDLERGEAALLPEFLLDLVASDTVEPGLESPLILQVRQLMKHDKEDFLGEILGILSTIDHSIDEVEDPLAVMLVNQPVGFEVATSGSANDLRQFGL